jgi:two-component system response regulator CpxR
MAVLVVDAATFCHGAEVVDGLVGRLGLQRLSDEDLFARAAEHYQVAPKKLHRLMYGPPSFFGTSRREKTTLVAVLRACLAEEIGVDGRIYAGLAGHLLPPTLTHTLKVCLGGTAEWRLEQAMAAGLGRHEAERAMARDDEVRAEWIRLVTGRGPWDKSLVDVFVAMQDETVESAVALIAECAERPVLKLTAAAEQAVRDFRLAAAVGVAMAEEGHDVDVLCQRGAVEILIKHHSLFLERLERELEEIARRVPGVTAARAHPGPDYREPAVAFNVDVEVPSKVLLVDDEKEFVHTLSERLQTRQIEPAIAYDGEQALAMVATDEPDVIVLDLKMPGIDGIEVLRRVKRTNPRTEVIILTGHGSDAEEQLAAELGAFAYLRKPVDLDVLTETMKAAYRRVNENRGGNHD